MRNSVEGDQNAKKNEENSMWSENIIICVHPITISDDHEHDACGAGRDARRERSILIALIGIAFARLRDCCSIRRRYLGQAIAWRRAKYFHEPQAQDRFPRACTDTDRHFDVIRFEQVWVQDCTLGEGERGGV